jgi:DNA-directed RNA polymerase specialized sigma24 family protein
MWPDALQLVAVAMQGFQFDPQRSNGAKESTALCSLINHQVLSMLRREHADQARRNRRADKAWENGEPLAPGNLERDVWLQIDVRNAIDELPERHRFVCTRLMEGDSIARIAKALRCTWWCARRIVDDIRSHFESRGIDGWVRG